MTPRLQRPSALAEPTNQPKKTSRSVQRPVRCRRTPRQADKPGWVILAQPSCSPGATLVQPWCKGYLPGKRCHRAIWAFPSGSSGQGDLSRCAGWQQAWCVSGHACSGPPLSKRALPPNSLTSSESARKAPLRLIAQVSAQLELAPAHNTCRPAAAPVRELKIGRRVGTVHGHGSRPGNSTRLAVICMRAPCNLHGGGRGRQGAAASRAVTPLPWLDSSRGKSVQLPFQTFSRAPCFDKCFHLGKVVHGGARPQGGAAPCTCAHAARVRPTLRDAG